MAVKTTLEQLEEVQAAITAVMEGQEVLVNGKRWAGADLDALHKREEVLLARYHSEQRSNRRPTAVGLPRRP